MKSRLLLQQGLMEGKVIKEEQSSVVAVAHGPSPCPSPLLAASSSSINVGGVVPAALPPGKENRRVGSPLNTNNNASEILTRSRSKGQSLKKSTSFIPLLLQIHLCFLFYLQKNISMMIIQVRNLE